MEFRAALDDVRLLADAPGRCLTGSFPHLRFVCLVPPEVSRPFVEALPRHLARRVITEPSPEVLQTGAQVVLTEDVAAAATKFPGFRPEQFVTWSSLAESYERWMNNEYLPHQTMITLYTPERLYPVGWTPPRLTLEIIGGCQAEALKIHSEWFPQLTVGRVRAFHTLQNYPVPTSPSEPARPDAAIVVAPLRLMHPDFLDDVVEVQDHATFFTECVERLVSYLDSVRAVRGGLPLFVQGFLEPMLHPEGGFFYERSSGNFKHFVRMLNDEIVRWCEADADAYFVDSDAIAAGVGKNFLDEGPQNYFAHRTPRDPTEEKSIIAGRWSVSQYYVAIYRFVGQQLLTISGAAQVKAVIVDLDNTLWDGLASDLELGTWEGRPAGLVEALKILKRRGILLAVASKNDEQFIRSHWQQLLTETDEPLRMPFSLDEFDAVRINFRPKSETVAEILAEFNLLEESVVLIDDNPLEREEVQARFPGMRILGAELHYVRSELLYSPFTQRHMRTAEDALRAATIHQQAALQEKLAEGEADEFLASLGLTCSVFEISDTKSAAGRRAIQLVNKTNQWNLNGARIAEEQAALSVASGLRLIGAEVSDRSNDYGLVVSALVDPSAGVVSHMVVSCRVIGMGIDRAVASWLEQRFGPLRYDFVETELNKAARDFAVSFRGSDEVLDLLLEDVFAPEHVLVKSA